jgi:protease IV
MSDMNRNNNDSANWERQALEHLLLENLKETRKARRWKAVFRVLTLLIFIGIVLAVLIFICQAVA